MLETKRVAPLLLLLLSFGVRAEAARSPDLVQPAFPNVTYAVVDGNPIALDIYLPQGSGPFPLLVWIHGGAWMAGDKFPAPSYVLPLLNQGVAVASVNYRLTMDPRFPNRTFPAQIWDVKGAVRFLRANAEAYRLDPHRIACWGGSAGGHLSALLGTSGGVEGLEGDVGGNGAFSSRVMAAVDYYGPTCIECLAPVATSQNGPMSAFLGHDFGDLLANQNNPNPPYPELVALMQSAGAVHHVDPLDPPFFVAHGDSDHTVPYDQSTLFVDALRAAGVPVEFHLVPGAGHDGGAMPSDLPRAFLLSAFATWHLDADFSVSPQAPSDKDDIAFSASAAGATPPYTFTWDLDGIPATGQEVKVRFPAGTHRVLLTVNDDTGAQATAERSVAVSPSVTVASVTKGANPFRLIVTGSGFQQGCHVEIGGVTALRTVFQSSASLVAKGNGLSAMVPKGVAAQITVVNPDGGRSAPYPFMR